MSNEPKRGFVCEVTRSPNRDSVVCATQWLRDTVSKAKPPPTGVISDPSFAYYVTSGAIAAGIDCRRDVPQILFELTKDRSDDREKADIAYWYYQDVAKTPGLDDWLTFQQNVRIFTRVMRLVAESSCMGGFVDELAGIREQRRRRLRKARLDFVARLRSHLNKDARSATEMAVRLLAPLSVYHDSDRRQTLLCERLQLEDDGDETWADDLVSTLDLGLDGLEDWPHSPTWDDVLVGLPQSFRDRLDDDGWFDRLAEVSHGLGLVDPRWGNEHDCPPLVLRVPEEAVLAAKIHGLKTAIEGFDDLLVGGVIPALPSKAKPSKPRQGCLGVIRGRYGTGKTTLATQLAFEMARKGGVGAILSLEQSVDEIKGQAVHFGWIPPTGAERSFELFERWDEFADYLRPPAKLGDTPEEAGKRRGALYIEHPDDATLSSFQRRLEDIVDLEGFDQDTFPLRFIIVDPVEAVQFSSRDLTGATSTHRVRNRTQQILRWVTQTGASLWITTSAGHDAEHQTPYGFLPNIGDVVIRHSLLDSGRTHERRRINEPPFRLIEFEKVRNQLFAKGVHAFHILSGEGIHVYPSGEALKRAGTWLGDPAEELGHSPTTSVSTGHATLDLALGTDGVRRWSVTTLMGPTGCAKTELALLYLLQDWNKDDRDPNERALFIAFRDTWESIREALDGPIGKQLKVDWVNDHEKVRRCLDVLSIDVGNVTSGQIFQRIRRAFRERTRGTHYHRVVVDNVAYMDLTAPLVRDDPLFVPNLLELLKRERVTPMFITSLVEGVVAESTVQTQIRDASHNLLVLKRNSYGTHHFVALQIKKSHRLVHLPQPMEVELRDIEVDSGDLRKELKQLAEVELRDFMREGEILVGDGAAGAEWWRGWKQRRAKPGEDSAAVLDAYEEIYCRASALKRDEPISSAKSVRGTTNYQADRWKHIREFLGRPTNPDLSLEGPELYRMRTRLADFTHRIYVEFCEAAGIVSTTQPEPRVMSELRPTIVGPEGAEEAKEVNKITRAASVHLRLRADEFMHLLGQEQMFGPWRKRYQQIMEKLEVQPGVSIRLHTLDDYARPMGDDKIERLGMARFGAPVHD